MRISDITNTTRLYRGDSSYVDNFEIGKTDAHALFGRGIYLTSSPEVAGDYRFKQGDDIIFPTGRDEQYASEKELVRAYLGKIAVDLGFTEAHTAMRDPFEKKANLQRREVYANNPRATYDDVQAALEAVNEEYKAARRKLAQSFVAKAKKAYAGMDIKMVRKTTGEWVFVKPDRGGIISAFDVPNEYIAKTLDAEAPLPDSLLPVMKAAFYANNRIKDSRLDLRTWDKATGGQLTGLTFDEYIKGFKENGTFYAWASENIGGKGVNPSIDEMLNGTHQGYYVWEQGQDLMVQKFMALGYVGFRYQGGVRIGGTGNRGGGGILHNAYSFWDEKTINSFRVDHHTPEPDLQPAPAKGIRAKGIV